MQISIPNNDIQLCIVNGKQHWKISKKSIDLPLEGVYSACILLLCNPSMWRVQNWPHEHDSLVPRSDHWLHAMCASTCGQAFATSSNVMQSVSRVLLITALGWQISLLHMVVSHRWSGQRSATLTPPQFPHLLAPCLVQIDPVYNDHSFIIHPIIIVIFPSVLIRVTFVRFWYGSLSTPHVNTHSLNQSS